MELDVAYFKLHFPATYREVCEKVELEKRREKTLVIKGEKGDITDLPIDVLAYIFSFDCDILRLTKLSVISKMFRDAVYSVPKISVVSLRDDCHMMKYYAMLKRFPSANEVVVYDNSEIGRALKYKFFRTITIGGDSSVRIEHIKYTMTYLKNQNVIIKIPELMIHRDKLSDAILHNVVIDCRRLTITWDKITYQLMYTEEFDSIVEVYQRDMTIYTYDNGILTEVDKTIPISEMIEKLDGYTHYVEDGERTNILVKHLPMFDTIPDLDSFCVATRHEEKIIPDDRRVKKTLSGFDDYTIQHIEIDENYIEPVKKPKKKYSTDSDSDDS